MKLTRFKKLDLIPNALGVFFGVPLLLVFVSHAVELTPAANTLCWFWAESVAEESTT